MEIIVRATIVYFVLFLVTRGLGKRELSQMAPFDLLLLVVVGDLVQQGVTQEDMSVTGAVLAVGTIATWVLIVSYLGFRFQRARKLVEAEPVLVVRDGKIIRQVLHDERVSEEDLLGAAREQGIGDIGDVEVGILESGGAFSFVLARDAVTPPGSRHRPKKPSPA